MRLVIKEMSPKEKWIWMVVRGPHSNCCTAVELFGNDMLLKCICRKLIPVDESAKTQWSLAVESITLIYQLPARQDRIDKYTTFGKPRLLLVSLLFLHQMSDENRDATGIRLIPSCLVQSLSDPFLTIRANIDSSHEMNLLKNSECSPFFNRDEESHQSLTLFTCMALGFPCKYQPQKVGLPKRSGNMCRKIDGIGRHW